jgi:hypothetical protein
MPKLDEALAALREIEPELRKPTQEGMASSNLAERLRGIRKLLAKQETQWISTAKAQQLLAFSSEDNVKTWVRIGMLRGRTLPDGRMEVPLDDVLREREAREGLLAFGGDDLTEEELEIMYNGRPGTVPWEREQQSDPSR